jgi:hypothetical protein
VSAGTAPTRHRRVGAPAGTSTVARASSGPDSSSSFSSTSAASQRPSRRRARNA